MATRFFNTAGPIKPASHYCIPPLQRLDPQALPALIRQEKYFVLHAPRQTGRTSAPLALRDLLNSGAEGGHRCLHANVEGAQAMRENLEPAMRAVLGELASRARAVLKDEFSDGAWPGAFRRNAGLALRWAGPQLLLQAFLQRIVNGGGRIEREYGLGRGRTDLPVLWPQTPGAARTPAIW